MPNYNETTYTHDEYETDQKVKYYCSGNVEWCDIHDAGMCDIVFKETGDECPYCKEEGCTPTTS
jgi:hypothetical protein